MDPHEAITRAQELARNNNARSAVDFIDIYADRAEVLQARIDALEKENARLRSLLAIETSKPDDLAREIYDGIGH